MPELIAMFCVGAVFGGLIVVAWLHDGSIRISDDPTEHGGRPL